MNFKTTVLVLFLLLSQGFAQQAGNISRPWKVGVFYSQDFSFPVYYIEGIKSFPYSKPAFAFTTGVSGLKSVSQRTEFGFSVGYSNKDYIGSKCWGCCEGLPEPWDKRYHLRFIDVSLFSRIHIIQKKFGLFIEPGLTLNKQLTGPMDEFSLALYYNPTLLSAYIGCGLDYNLNEKFSLSISPQFRQSCYNNIEKGWMRLTSVGLAVGAAMKLGK